MIRARDPRDLIAKPWSVIWNLAGPGPGNEIVLWDRDYLRFLEGSYFV